MGCCLGSTKKSSEGNTTASKPSIIALTQTDKPEKNPIHNSTKINQTNIAKPRDSISAAWDVDDHSDTDQVSKISTPSSSRHNSERQNNDFKSTNENSSINQSNVVSTPLKYEEALSSVPPPIPDFSPPVTPAVSIVLSEGPEKDSFLEGIHELPPPPPPPVPPPLPPTDEIPHNISHDLAMEGHGDTSSSEEFYVVSNSDMEMSPTTSEAHS